jgi:hypothetical protein
MDIVAEITGYIGAAFIVSALAVVAVLFAAGFLTP